MVLFYTAISGDGLNTESIFSLTKHKIISDLQPVLRKKERFDLEIAQNNVKSYLDNLLVLADDEQQFLTNFENHKYSPELLFDGEILERVLKHPMALWRTREE